MSRSVVAGVDGSPEGLTAADWAAREALRRGLPLRLVHAWEAGLPEGAPETGPSGLRAPQQHARQVLQRALARLGERYPRLDVTAEQVPRAPVAALLAEAADADLLVIGSQGPSGLGGFLSGAVALATVARIARPVVLVRAGLTAEAEHLPGDDGTPSEHTPYRDVAVAVDVDAPPADEVLDFAFRAAALRNAPLRAVHAWHMPFSHRLPDAEQRARAREAAENRLSDLLAPWQREYPGVVVRENLHEGRPAHVLVRAAGGAGLLVVGNRRKPGPAASRGDAARTRTDASGTGTDVSGTGTDAPGTSTGQVATGTGSSPVGAGTGPAGTPTGAAEDRTAPSGGARTALSDPRIGPGDAGAPTAPVDTRIRPAPTRTTPVAHALIHHVRCPVALVPHD
ncbi:MULTISPECIES: universal stress protein [Streptomyces]|uniref:Universal stress protein n=1 Tax=Streptomyces griseosporeus TaxID=1910 RepID=A0ABV3KWL7_STRGS|nr:universal stress protein [Streptomyces actuosus]